MSDRLSRQHGPSREQLACVKTYKNTLLHFSYEELENEKEILSRSYYMDPIERWVKMGAIIEEIAVRERTKSEQSRNLAQRIGDIVAQFIKKKKDE